MNEAFGSASRMCRAKPSMKSYWLRCASSAMTTMLRRSESTGWRSPFSSGKNFWIVVNTTPPDATASSSPQVGRGSRPAPASGAADLLAARERAEQLVVEVVAVGQHDDRRVLHRRVQDDAPGVERHRQALAGALRVPDHAAAAVALGARCGDRLLHRRLDRVELVVAGEHLRQAGPSSRGRTR